MMRRMLRQVVASGSLWIWIAALAAGIYATSWPPESAVAQNPAAGQNPAAANQQYLTAAGLHNRQAWELAADEWARFIKDFPGDARVNLVRHYLGQCRLQLKDYAGAAAAFQELIAADPKFEQIALSRLWLGMAQYNLGQAGKSDQFAAAEKTLASLLRDIPQGKHVPQALYFLAESLYSQKKRQEAEPLYARFVKEFPDEALAPDALYAHGVVLEELNQSQAAQAAYLSFVEKFPDNALRTEVDVRRADLLFAAGDAAAAEPLFAAAAADAKYEDADYALLRQAGCLFDLKKFAAAADLYEQLGTRFPKSQYRAAAQLAAGRNRYFAGQFAEAYPTLMAAASGGGEAADEAKHYAVRALLKSGRAADAEKLLVGGKSGKQADKLSAQLLLDLGDAQYDQPERRADALKTYQSLVEKFADDPLAAQGRYLAALTALDLGRNGDARKSADAYLKRHSGGELTADVLYIKAEAQLRDGDHAAAAATYDQLLAATGADDAARKADRQKWIVRRAFALASAGKHAEVVGALGSAVKTLDDARLAAEARQLLGVSKHAIKDYAGAIADLDVSLRLDPQRRGADDALLAMAEAQRLSGDAAGAEASIERLARDYPESPLLDTAFYRRGESAYAAGDFAAAEKAYRRVLDDYPKSRFAPYARYGTAWAALGRNDASTAAAAIDELLKAKPPAELAAKAYYARALAREQLKQYGPAIDDLNAYLKSKPTGNDRSEALYWLGRSQMGAKQDAAALTTFTQLLESDSQYAGASKVLYEVGWLHRAAGREKESAAAFARLAKEHPQSPLVAEALFHVGEEAYARKDYDAAIDGFYDAREKAAAARSDELAEKSAYNLGWTYFHKENFPKAEEWFRFQLKQYDDGALAESARFMLGESLFKQQKYEEALAEYRAVKNLPEVDFNTLALLHGGQCAVQLKEWKLAQTLLDEAAEKFPNSPYLAEINYERGWVLDSQNDLEGAKKLYELVTEQSQGITAARARYMIGNIFFKQKNHTEAIRHFFKVAYGYAYPEWQARAQFEAGRCFEVLGKLDQARKSYDEIVQNFGKSEEAALAKERLAALNRTN